MEPDFIYPLTLPPIDERLLPGMRDILLAPSLRSASAEKDVDYLIYDIEEAVLPEWHRWMGIRWKSLSKFYKNNYTGVIHTDDATNAANSWGINWVCSGYGNMKYWNKNRLRITVDSQQPTWKSAPFIERYDTDNPPCQEYTLLPGAYLVNNSIPHLASGYQHRVVLSLRPAHPDNRLPWENVRSIFKEFIKSN